MCQFCLDIALQCDLREGTLKSSRDSGWCFIQENLTITCKIQSVIYDHDKNMYASFCVQLISFLNDIDGSQPRLKHRSMLKEFLTYLTFYKYKKMRINIQSVKRTFVLKAVQTSH